MVVMMFNPDSSPAIGCKRGGCVIFMGLPLLAILTGVNTPSPASHRQTLDLRHPARFRREIGEKSGLYPFTKESRGYKHDTSKDYICITI